MQPFKYIEKKVFKHLCCSYTTDGQKALLPQSFMVFAHNKVLKPQCNIFFFNRSENLSYTILSTSSFPSFYPGKFLCHFFPWADLSISIYSSLYSCCVFLLTASGLLSQDGETSNRRNIKYHHYYECSLQFFQMMKYSY